MRVGKEIVGSYFNALINLPCCTVVSSECSCELRDELSSFVDELIRRSLSKNYNHFDFE